ncbi:MAG: hypothetical protein V4621_07705 [Pseudomonadota bacterium]
MLSSYKDQNGKQRIAYVINAKSVMSLPAKLNNFKMPSLKEAAAILRGVGIAVEQKPASDVAASGAAKIAKELKAARAVVNSLTFGTTEWEAAMAVVRKLVDAANEAAPKTPYKSVDGNIFN